MNNRKIIQEGKFFFIESVAAEEISEEKIEAYLQNITIQIETKKKEMASLEKEKADFEKLKGDLVLLKDGN